MRTLMQKLLKQEQLGLDSFIGALSTVKGFPSAEKHHTFALWDKHV